MYCHFSGYVGFSEFGVSAVFRKKCNLHPPLLNILAGCAMLD